MQTQQNATEELSDALTGTLEDREEQLRDLTAEFHREVPQNFQRIQTNWQCIEPGKRDEPILSQLHLILHKFAERAATFGFLELCRRLYGVEEELWRLLTEDDGPLSREAYARIDDALSGARTTFKKEMQLRSLLDPLYADKKGQEEEKGPTKIILVEEDPHLAKILMLEIGRYGYEVEVMSKADVAEADPRDESPGAVIMDIVLPEGTAAGVESIKRVWPHVGQETPIVLISTHRDLAARLEAVRSGSEVYFAKPAEVKQLFERLHILTAESTEDPYRILIVEHDVVLGLRISVLLERQGMRTRIVNDPLESLPAVTDFRPDVVLTDLYMPSCSGAELAAVIRQEDEYVSLPIIFLSSETDFGTHLSAMAMGGDLFLTKPIEDAQLLDVVKTRAKRHRLLQAVLKRGEVARALSEDEVREAREGDATARMDRAEVLASELRHARQMQLQMLPTIPDVEGMEIDVVYEPCDEVGGDFYDFIDLGDGKFGIAIGDVTGHGVSAALVMSMCKKVVALEAKRTDSPAETMISTNRELGGELDKKTFVTMIYGVLDLNARTFRFVRAGHDALFLHNPKRAKVPLLFQPKGIALGLTSSERFESIVEEVEIAIEPGDHFLIFTDGLTEVMNASHEEYGRDRVRDFMSQDITTKEAVDGLYRDVLNFSTGRTIDDDITILAWQFPEAG